MGFFAVLRGPQERQSPRVLRCHLNLWILNRKVLPTQLLWDVGLLIAPRAASERFSLQLALPFRASVSGCEDLSEVIKTHPTAALVFGEPVEVSGDRIRISSYGENWIAVRPVGPDQLSRVDTLSGRDYAVWDISNLESQEEGENLYVRLRFAVEIPGMLWRWQPSVFSRQSALVDLRVSDVRGASRERWTQLAERIVDLDQLNAFVIAPVNLHVQSHSPAFRYVRLLEPEVWQAYLGNTKGRPKLAIYHWMSKQEGVNPKDPFLGFMNLRSEPPHRVLALRAALMVLLAYWGLSWVTGTAPPWASALVAAFSWEGLVAGGALLVPWLLNIQALGGLLLKLREAWITRDLRRVA